MTRHHATCHCGAVRLDVDDLDLASGATCNCSICARTGAIMVFVPEERLLNVVGRDQLVDYQFAKRSTHHAFCRTCGTRPFAWGQGKDGKAYAMVNLRCLEGVDVHQLAIAHRYDGRSL